VSGQDPAQPSDPLIIYGVGGVQEMTPNCAVNLRSSRIAERFMVTVR
jgi:hypothetical protein